MEKVKSLRTELIYDLSLLSFCALVLSSGLLIILLRMNLPEQLTGLAKSYISNVHQNFVKTTQLDQPSLDEVKAAWVEFSAARFDESADPAGWSQVILEPALGNAESESFSVQDREFLLVLPTIQDFYYQVPLNDEISLTYRWSLKPLHLILDQYKFIVFFASILIAAVLVFIGYHLLFRRNILVPLKNLSDTAESFLNEEWSARCTVLKRDELGQIAEVLNEMARKIQDKEKKLVLTIQSLQKANEEIEASKNEQLQIEKLASVGRLAAGVAHEVGNPLGAISGYIDILRRSMQKTSESKEDLDLCDRIEAETNRISKIIRALLQQARPPQDRIKPVKLMPVVRRSIELAQIPEGISVQVDFEDQEAEALCEKDQLIQVFLNLLINAKHAIESMESQKDGEIKIRCVSRKLPTYQSSDDDDGEVKLETSVVRALKPQTYWMVSISDNGAGIATEDQKKLFEPFFSTKATGKGTGLGLYVAKSIIESFRGAIVVRSSVGYGTSFSIFLPQDI